MSKLIDKHITELNDLRKQRNEIRAENSFLIKKTEDILNSFHLDNGSTLITFKELHSLELNKVYDVNDGVSFIMESKTENKLVFTTYMQDSGKFGLQEHDCFEICKIIKGNLFETNRGYKVYTKDDIIAYAPFEKHKPYSTKESVYQVTFYKKIT